MFSAATTTEKISFHLLNRATGHRLRRQMVDGETGEVVDTEDQIHGYEVSKGDYVEVEGDEIDRLRIESTHTIDVERFVIRTEVEDVYLDHPYYLAPDGATGEEAFAVIREAMRHGSMVGIARLVLARREHMVMVEPLGRGMLLTTLRFPYEVRSADEAFDEIGDHPVSDEMLDLADHIIRSKRGPFEPEHFEDRFEKALVGLIEAIKAGRPPEDVGEPERPSNVIDLMDALRRSVGDPPAGKTKQAGKQAGKQAAKSKPAPAGKPRAAKTAAKKSGGTTTKATSAKPRRKAS